MDNSLPLWLNNYVLMVCEELKIDSAKINYKLATLPKGKAAMFEDFAYPDEPTIKFDRACYTGKDSRTAHYKKVVIHEHLHYKHRHIDDIVEVSAIPLNKNNKAEEVKKEYIDSLEKFIEDLTDVIYKVINNRPKN